jgi:predicted CopG family antitoxin
MRRVNFKQVNVSEELLEQLKSMRHPGQTVAGVIQELLDHSKVRFIATKSNAESSDIIKEVQR